MRNVLLKIQYDGTNFHGWQRQPGIRTVQGELERVLMMLCGDNIQIDGTSRTDAGVHALGQQVTLRGEFGIPADRIIVAANNILAGGMNTLNNGDIKIIESTEMPEWFHARFDSKGKTYVYRIDNNPGIDIFRRNYCYQVSEPLDISAMRIAAAIICGTHDFKCFEAAGGQKRKTTVRTIYDLTIEERDHMIDIFVTGDGFLYNMVRIITGTLVDVGRGKISADNIATIIAGCNRQTAGHTAPPQGLYLAEIYYTDIEKNNICSNFDYYKRKGYNNG